MEALIASAIAVLGSCGIYLVLRERTFTVILGLALLAISVNLFLLSMGRVAPGHAPVIEEGIELVSYVDPLPQAVVLTAIVIGFAMMAFVVVLSISAHFVTGTDHLDGEEQSP